MEELEMQNTEIEEEVTDLAEVDEEDLSEVTTTDSSNLIIKAVAGGIGAGVVIGVAIKHGVDKLRARRAEKALGIEAEPKKGFFARFKKNKDKSEEEEREVKEGIVVDEPEKKKK